MQKWVLVFIPKTCRTSEGGLIVIFEGAGQGGLSTRVPSSVVGLSPTGQGSTGNNKTYNINPLRALCYEK